MFPIYMDNNATTAVDNAVVQAMLPFLTTHYGNASSRHGFGEPVVKALRIARRNVQFLIGAERETEIIFTSCGTEADATAILSAVKAYPDRKEIITTAVEHAAVLSLCLDLEREGYTIHQIGVDDRGQIDMAAYEAALSAKVAVASIMWANNETGAIFPVIDMAAKAKAAGVLFHTDAVQAAGKIQINVAKTDIDMLSISGHKFHGPKGIGALYVRKGTPYRPLLRGGHQERGRRAGTENVANIVALGAAAALAQQRISQDARTVASLRDCLQSQILTCVPGATALAITVPRLPNTLAIMFPQVKGEALLAHLDRQGIAASGGSACNAGSIAPSHVALAMGITPLEALGLVRFSLSHLTTQDEVTQVAEVVATTACKLRSASVSSVHVQACVQ